ncbi:carbohydrate-binding protein [Vibrio profundi]|uniref:carbohydrate-binding protein n=1 Tax=Vibrio profundi TaxID=1774960 RepID=UPI003735F900
MKKKFIAIVLFIAIVFIPTFAYAADEWDKNAVYESGDTVKWKGLTYISSYWTQGTEPVDNQISWDGWITIDTDSIEAWKQSSTYNGGDVVEYNSGFYLAKWWNTNEIPSTSSEWQRLDINTIVKPTPDPDDTNIIGKDNDGDGLRDDYAVTIEESYTESKEIALATQAGREFGKLLEFSENDIEITVEDAQLMATNGIALQYCIDVYKMENPEFLNPIDLYFDTLDRAIANREASTKLYKSLQGNEPVVTEINCDKFLEGVSK